MSPVSSEPLEAEIRERLGYLPPVLRPALEAPSALEGLWRQTVSTYLDNPLPARFKETLFAALSRACGVAYFTITQSCRLRSLGMSGAEIAEALAAPLPHDPRDVERELLALGSLPGPLSGWPEPGSVLEQHVLRCAALMFLNPADSGRCQTELRRLLGLGSYAHLAAFLAYVKSAHSWAQSYRDVSHEADGCAQEHLAPLLAEEPRLARLLGLEDREPKRAEPRLLPKQPAGEGAIDLRGVKALVVDDDAAIRRSLSRTLVEWGASAAEAESGAQGLVQLKRARDLGEPYRLILIQCRTAGMNGFDFADHLRNDPETLARTIVMLPANHWVGDPARVRELGMAGHLAKPITRLGLQAALSEVLGTAKAGPGKSAAESSPRSSLRILVAEDSKEGRALIRYLLDGPRYQIEIAENGSTALDMFRIRRYDLVIMDIHMPGMDGYSATQAIREWERKQLLRPTPIIALTAYAGREDAQKSLRAGCMAYLTKPVTRERLKAVVEKQTTSAAH